MERWGISALGLLRAVNDLSTVTIKIILSHLIAHFFIVPLLLRVTNS
jgi:hypothetical protein